MKRTLYTKINTIILVFTVGILAGCTDFLTDQPESVLTQVDFYTTPTRINQGVIGCYAGLATIVKDEWMFTELRSDNACLYAVASSSGSSVDQTDLAFFRPSPSLPLIQKYWYNTFQNISNVNAVLPSVADNSYVTIETQRAQYEAELLFIRALHYYNLVNLFGDMFKITTVIGPNDAKKLTRRPASEIYAEIIIPDLIKASAGAPASYSSGDAGRVTKWAAKSLLAKVYMTLGGAENIALAKPLLEDVLANSGSGLITSKGTFASAYSAIFDVANEMNKEIIFAVRYLGGSSGIGSSFWGWFAPSGSANLFLKIGTPLGFNSPTYEMRAKFTAEANDTRKDASFRTWIKPGSTDTIPYISKFTDATMTQALQAENDWIILRYADVQLLYAEVLAQGANPDNARAEVNKIRARAGVSSYLNFASKEEALDSVYAERRLELAFENQRWFDLLRMAKSYNNPEKPIEVMKQHVFVTDWARAYSKFNPIPVPEERFFTTERLLLPIPQTEIDTNNEIEIKQNSGY